MSVEGHASQSRKPDPDVKIPEAVKRAAARSDELILQSKPAPPAVTVAKFDPANPKPPEPVVPSPSSPPPPPPSGEPEDFKHKFESANGRLERAEREKTELAQRLADMQRTVAFMSTPPAPAPQREVNSDVRFGTLKAKVTDAELKEYGPELIDMMSRVAAQTYEPVVAQLQSELAQVKGQVGGVRNAVVQDHQTQLYAELTRQIPNWQQINVDPQFLAWLSYPDDLSGVPRAELLDAAFRQGQMARVVSAFRGFLAYQAAYGPARGNGQASGNGAVTLESNSQNNASTPDLDLASLAAPGRAKSGQTQVPPEKPDVTRTEISLFYRDLAQGKYRGREQEVAAIELQIQDAVREGRIR